MRILQRINFMVLLVFKRFSFSIAVLCLSILLIVDMDDILERDIPHFHGHPNTKNWKPHGSYRKVYDNILHAIGDTPLVRLNRIPKDHGLKCEIYAKCEFFNPGGSIKDRIAYAMITEAKERGIAKHGTHVVEPTSGNTGIGLALMTALEGYKCTIVTPDKNSDEKLNTMRLLGADIIQTPSNLHHSDPGSYMGVTANIMRKDPKVICLNQFSNEVNPYTHNDFTAEEIVDALGRVDMLVASVGTGGTYTGLSHRIKKLIPDCVTVAVDPDGSSIFGGNPHPFLVEGIGGDYVPHVLDKKADLVERPNDIESFTMAREIIRKEGILCGGSSGTALYAAIKAAKEKRFGEGKRVVVIFPDSIRNYMNKFVSDQWMEANLFKKPPAHDHLKWWNQPIEDLKIIVVPLVDENQSCFEALKKMGDDHSVALITDKNKNYVGAISKDSLRKAATNANDNMKLHFTDPVKKHMMKNVYKVAKNEHHPTVGLLSRILDITPFVVIVKKNEACKTEATYKPKGIVTPELIMQFILKYES